MHLLFREGKYNYGATDQVAPTLFIVFGGAGDLTWQKLIPSIFAHFQDSFSPYLAIGDKF
ncbi:MAG: hypothetical protein H0U49_08950 [Parachlamydiaceae bacterium]|nr:hypothetical protein [Parachlamydiaceae bacterium]